MNEGGDHPDRVVELATGPVPPVTAAEKAKQLRAAVVGAISERDVGHVMQTLLIRAKGGDLKAIQMVLDVIGTEQPESQPVPAPQQIGVQVNVGERDRADVRVAVAEPVGGTAEIDQSVLMNMRARAARVLADRGVLAPNILADECNIPESLVDRVVSTDCLWFARSSRGVVLTVIGRREALPS